jgi:hypothetical protein
MLRAKIAANIGTVLATASTRSDLNLERHGATGEGRPFEPPTGDGDNSSVSVLILLL